jgi:nucleoside 2-deoxyribosyltransferase
MTILTEIIIYVNTYILNRTFISYSLFTACIAFVVYMNIYSNNDTGHYNYVYRKRGNMSKSIYVAGAWIHREKLNIKMNKLKDLGFLITSNWPSFEDKLTNPDDYAECSIFDIDGVVTADTVLAIMTDPKYPYRGTYTEIGCAIGSGRRIIVVCDGVCSHKKNNECENDKYNLSFSHYCMENIFFWDPRIEHVSTFEDAIKLLKGEKLVSPYNSFYSGRISDNLSKSTYKIYHRELDYCDQYTDQYIVDN